jgi:hypothetical protein
MTTGRDFPTLVKLKNVYARYVADIGESDQPSVNSGVQKFNSLIRLAAENCVLKFKEPGLFKKT